MAGLINNSKGLAYFGKADYSALKGSIVTLELDTTIKAGLATATSYPDGYIEVGKKVTEPCTINAFYPGDRVGIPVGATHAAIAVGDLVTMSADGTVIKAPTTGAGTYTIIGMAETALALDTAGFVTVRVAIREFTIGA